jgi:hypothetical protein
MTFGASETDATAQASAPGFLSPGARVQPSHVAIAGNLASARRFAEDDERRQ